MEVKAELCIICDEVSKEAANGFCNKLSNRYNCIVWTVKEFHDNKTTTFKTISNRQKVLYLSEELIKDNLPSEMWDQHFQITEYTSMVRIGNQYGIILDNVVNVPFLSGRDWWKYLLALVGLGILSSAVAWGLWKRRKKDAVPMKKKKLYFDAVQHLVERDNLKKLFSEE